MRWNEAHEGEKETAEDIDRPFGEWDEIADEILAVVGSLSTPDSGTAMYVRNLSEDLLKACVAIDEVKRRRADRIARIRDRLAELDLDSADRWPENPDMDWLERVA